MACFCGSSYKNDVNIGNLNFLSVDITLNKSQFLILDSYGRVLEDQ